MKIGFIGSDVMSSNIASRLLAAGHELLVYDHSASKAEQLAQQGAQFVNAPCELTEANVIISVLSDDKAHESVVYGEGGLLKNIRSECIHIAMGTLSAELAEQLNLDHQLLDTSFVGAPVFGAPESVSSGDLMIAAGGEGGVLEKCRPIFEAIAKKIFHVSSEPALALQCH